MQTNFTAAQLSDPNTATAESVIRKCVHCGFCTATCPTYVLLGDELDSPRGRIYLMKEMLEKEQQPTPEIVKHIDRCLSCLACQTTCPSGVNYMHLVDHARAYVELRYRRPLADRLLRAFIAWALPHPRRFRAVLIFARLAQPLRPLFARIDMLRPLAAALALATRVPSPEPRPRSEARRPVKGRVVLLQGCVENELRPEIRAAAVRLLNRCGYEVSFAANEVCCGSLVRHMGKEAASLEAARRNADAWRHETERGDLAAILVTASGCGTTIKDYGFMLRDDPQYAKAAADVSARAKDICEFLDGIALPPSEPRALTVAYQAPCSLQHGQKVTDAPRRLLEQAGFRVRVPADAHLCCGSAGTYNMLQPDIAAQLGANAVARLEALRPDVIASGNIGCMMQLAQRTGVPLAHTVELLDWATGGPAPRGV